MATKAERPTLTTNQLVEVFGVSAMSIYLWRQGTPTKTKLKTAKQKKGERAVLFYVDEALAWAEKNGWPVAKDPMKVLARDAKKSERLAANRPHRLTSRKVMTGRGLRVRAA